MAARSSIAQPIESPFTQAIDLHRVNIYTQIASTLPPGMHVPFNG